LHKNCGFLKGDTLMTCQEQIPWWLDHIAVPVIFLVLGFVAGQIKDYFDSRRVKNAFLRSIRVELSTLNKHLEGTLKEVTEVRDSTQQNGVRKVSHLSTTFQTGVYTSQLGRLRDVSDSLIREIIRLYDQLSNLEKVKAHVTARSFELTVLTGSKEDIERESPLAYDYASSLEEVMRRINLLIPATNILISKLPE
jgi:hypothetical protein